MEKNKKNEDNNNNSLHQILLNMFIFVNILV